MRKFQLRLGAAALAAFIFSVPHTTGAHEGAVGIVKDRMTAMENIGKAMKNLALMVRGKVPYDAEKVRRHALAIKRHAGPAMTKLFPEGSLQKPTAALPAIWQDWERFSRYSDQLSQTASELAVSAERGAPGIHTTFKQLAEVCRDCHTDFRQKK